MAGSAFPPGSSFTTQAYKAGLILEAERATRVMPLASKDENAAIVIEDFGGTKRGANLKMRFRTQRTFGSWTPKTRGVAILGSEASRTVLEDDLSLNYFSITDGAVELPEADQQNIEWDLIGAEHESMAKEAAEWLEGNVMAQLSGYTVYNDTSLYPDYALSGANIVTNFDADHHYMCPDSSGANATEALVAADSTAVLTTRVFDEVGKRLRSKAYLDYPIPPASTPWGNLYVALVHGTGIQQLRENSSDSDFYDLTRAMIEGGMDTTLTALWTGESFIYNGKFLILESDFCTQGLSGVAAGATTTGTAQANTRRAIVLGARAAHCIYGEGYVDGEHLGYTEHQRHRELSMQIDTVWGFKATIVNSQRWASFCITHYSDV